VHFTRFFHSRHARNCLQLVFVPRVDFAGDGSDGFQQPHVVHTCLAKGLLHILKSILEGFRYKHRDLDSAILLHMQPTLNKSS
jgi:hypothetical protein